MNVIFYVGLGIIWFSCFIKFAMWYDKKYDSTDGLLLYMVGTGVVIIILSFLI